LTIHAIIKIHASEDPGAWIVIALAKPPPLAKQSTDNTDTKQYPAAESCAAVHRSSLPGFQKPGRSFLHVFFSSRKCIYMSSYKSYEEKNL
jgi:hypothetical protein